MIRSFSIALFLMTISHQVLAYNLPDLGKYFHDMESNELKGVVGYESTNVKGKEMPLDQAESLGVTKREAENQDECNKGDCSTSAIFSSKNTIARQEKTENVGFTKDSDGITKNNKGYLDKAPQTVKNSKNEFDYLKGSYANCTPTQETISIKSEEICDQYYNMQTNSCLPRQIVEIDPKYNYICSKKREVKEKVCNDTIKSIKCKNSKECDLGGIEPGSVDSDIVFQYQNGELLIGNQNYARWLGTCAVYDKRTTFKLKNVNEIKEFRLIQARFDDYIQIEINGHSVYAGPDSGATKADLKDFTLGVGNKKSYIKGVDDGSGKFKPCERNTDWNRSLNIDLKPYLNEGINSIRFKVITTGTGTGSLKIRAKQNCCNEWDIQREEKCDYL